MLSQGGTRKWLVLIILLYVALVCSDISSGAGFDFPLGKPNGVGYGVQGLGGLDFLEPHNYKCGPVFHPGEDWNDDNTGRDFGANSNDANDPVYGVADGKILYAQFATTGWGYVVLIRHDGGFNLPEGGQVSTVWSQYGHLANISVNPRTGQLWKKDDTVFRGEQIGNVGDADHGSGSNFHLHFEIRKTDIGAISFPCNWTKSEVEKFYTKPTSFINLNRGTTIGPRYTFLIDNFKIIKNGTLLFEDNFSNGVPPPSAPNLPGGGLASYFVGGTVGPETNGKLTIDSSGAIVTSSIPPGSNFLLQRARLLTNIDPSDLTRGLKIDDTFSVTGVFDLIGPGPVVTGYGIALTDRSSTRAGNDDLRLEVRRTFSGSVSVSFSHSDATAGTFTTLTTFPLDLSHDQIALILRRNSTSNNKIFASFAYIDAGNVVGGVDLVTPGEIFRGENFTRAEFLAESRLP